MADFLCTSCGKCFSRKAAFQNHLSVHKEEPCECRDCGKVLKNKKQLSNHLDSHKKITCVGCNIVIPLNTKRYHDCAKTSEKEILFTLDLAMIAFYGWNKNTLKK